MAVSLPDPSYFRHFVVLTLGASIDSIGVIWLFIDCQTSPPSGFIYDLLVHAQFRGRGLGKLAMLTLERQATELGLTRLVLNVFEDNTVAKALYTSLGYKVQSSYMHKCLSID